MSHTVKFGAGEVEERLGALERYLTELQLHRDSRRGLTGAQGESVTGATGATGPAGKDADISEAVRAAKQAMEQEFGTLHKFLNAEALSEIIDHRLIVAGVLDENKKAILVPGPTGVPGVDSQVAGPKGESGRDGQSIVGRDGRDAKIEIGNVTAGEKASVSLREHEGVQFLDIVLPRGERGERGPAGESIRGEKGEPGQSIEGPQGIPGPGLSKSDVVAVILDMKNRKSI